MDRFHAITAFAKVVETGSFARAAERLEVSVSAVSRQVAELEGHLDARLLNRTTRRLSLTERRRGEAAWNAETYLRHDLWRAPSSTGDDPFRRALSRDAFRRRAVGSRGGS